METFLLNRDLQKGVLVYRLEGLLDISSMDGLGQILLDVKAEDLRGGAKGVILDCDQLRVNSKGVGAIHLLSAHLPVKMILVNVPERMKDVLKLFGLLDRFVFADSVAVAMRQISEAN